MTMSRIFATAASIAIFASPAHAQLGGMKLKVPGLGGGGSESVASVSAGDVDSFIVRAQQNTELLWLSYMLLKQAQQGKVDVAALAAKKKEFGSIPDPKERGAKMTAMLKTEDESAKFDDASAADLEKKIASQSPTVKAQIGAALINLAIAIPRAVDMVKEAPDLIKGLGSSPSALGSIGKLKNASSLLGSQVKYTASIAPMLPRLMSAAKVKPVANAKTSKSVDIPGL